MDDNTAMFIWVLIIIVIFCIIRIAVSSACREKPVDQPTRTQQRRVVQRIRIDPTPTTGNNATGNADRQGNIFTISDDASLNAGGNYADFFYVEPNSEEAARIRAQLEKDDKELPSYEEVMGMNNLATPTAGIGPDATTSAATVGTNTNTTTATIAALPAEVPPYSEVDPLSTTRAQGVSTVPSSSAGSVVITIPDEAAGSCAVPSTSRAAAAAAAAGTTTTTTTASIPIINSSSNTTV